MGFWDTLKSWFSGSESPSVPVQPTQDSPGTNELYCVIGGTKIYKKHNGVSVAVTWTGKADIDGDGSPRCYHPDSTSGLDALVNARDEHGNYVGVATKPNGVPYIQGSDAPEYSDSTKGFYVSTTALVADHTRDHNDPRRYVNSETEVYIVVPGASEFWRGLLGKRCTIEYQGITIEGIVADIGPRSKIGEISILAAKKLRIPSDCRSGGADKGVTYTVYV